MVSETLSEEFLFNRLKREFVKIEKIDNIKPGLEIVIFREGGVDCVTIRGLVRISLGVKVTEGQWMIGTYYGATRSIGYHEPEHIPGRNGFNYPIYEEEVRKGIVYKKK